LENNPKITTTEYYKSFRSLWGIVAIVFTILPAAAIFKPGRVFPPLGDQTVLALCFAIVLALVTTYIMFLFRGMSSSNIGRLIVALLVFSIIWFCVYFAAQLRFVRVIAEVGKDAHIVSVGYARTNFARANFPDASDEEMLRGRGLNDEDIRTLWTTKSLILSRLLLFVSCMGCTLSLVALASLGVLLHARESKVGG
jgi:hypothetical protein